MRTGDLTGRLLAFLMLCAWPGTTWHCLADDLSPNAMPPGWEQVEALQQTPILKTVTKRQLVDALGSDLPMVRMAALAAIARSDSDDHVDLVIQQLSDEDELTRPTM
ncbi:MAG: HEAT repeat domain-containing protein [Planctomycetota bacterium]